MKNLIKFENGTMEETVDYALALVEESSKPIFVLDKNTLFKFDNVKGGFFETKKRIGRERYSSDWDEDL